MEKKTYENFCKEINIRDLCFMILKKWKVILLCMVVMGILFSSWQYVKDKKENAEQDEISVEAGVLTEAEQAAVDEVLQLQGELKQIEDYKLKSDLLKIDPYNENKTVYSYLITADNKNIEVIVEAYSNFIRGEMLDEILEDGSIDLAKESLYELISIDYTTGDNTINVNLDENSKILSIMIISSTEELNAQISNKVKEEVEQYQTVLAAYVGNYEIKLLGENTSRWFNNSTFEKQERIIERCEALQKEIDGKTELLNAKQIKVLNGEEIIIEKKAEKVKFNVWYVVLGMLQGVIIGVLYYAVKYVLDNRVKSVDELRKSLSIHILGICSEEAIKKQNVLDRIIESVHMHGENIYGEEEMNALLYYDIINYCSDREVTKVYINLFEENFGEKMMSGLTQKLKQESIELEIGCEDVNKVGIVKKMMDYDCVIWVEKLGKVSYQTICREQMMCDKYRAECVGTVVVR